MNLKDIVLCGLPLSDVLSRVCGAEVEEKCNEQVTWWLKEMKQQNRLYSIRLMQV